MLSQLGPDQPDVTQFSHRLRLRLFRPVPVMAGTGQASATHASPLMDWTVQESNLHCTPASPPLTSPADQATDTVADQVNQIT